jgi:flagellar motor switch/type III secretory pathway protein FliN
MSEAPSAPVRATGAPLPRAFPWDRLPRVERAALQARRELSNRVAAGLDVRRLRLALGQLLGADAELGDVVLGERRCGSEPPSSLFDAHTLEFPRLGLRCTLRPEPDLARACVARLLGQGFELGWADTGIDATLRGAGAALALEVARRASRDEAPVLVTVATRSAEWQSAGHATLRLGGKPYRLALSAEALALGRPSPVVTAPSRLSQLGAVRIAVPWISALSAATVRQIEGLGVGDVWVPGKASWLASEPLSAGLLAAPRSARGVPIHVSAGRIVLGAEAVPVHEELTSMSQEESELAQIVGETPIVVRLELGSLEMSAAEWAGLRPGDVVQCGRRIEEPVVLRAGGREIARGELVDIEGELGVRITAVATAAVVP